jgi:class 3 adenylate cyclase
MDLSGQKTPAPSSSIPNTVAGTGYGREGKRSKAHILVVDDVPANVELLEALLITDGYDVTTAADGHEALDFVAEDEPDLVLLDVMMPGMNGFEVCEQLKAGETTRFIPIVLITALDGIEDKLRGIAAGADDFLTKPFNRQELKARVRSLLRIRRLHNEVEQKRRVLSRLLNRYVSEEIVNTILENPEERMQLGGEKREIAILFADIRGFTSFSENTSAEKVVEVLNECFHDITELVFKHRGTFDKYLGDSVLAFYGAPISYGDDLERCLHTALDMQKSFKRIRESWTDPQLKTLGLGIGINYGEVIVGNVGSERLMDYTVIGDKVNTAQRLEQSAQGDQILISETVYNLMADRIKATEIPPVTVKGKREPVRAYLLETIL